MNRHFYTYLFLTGIILLLFSCRDSELKRMPDTLPDLRGNINSLSVSEQDKGHLTILVKSEKETAAEVTEASVNVTEETLIEDSTGKKYSPEALQQGQEIEVWFGESVMETMPVQTNAIAIRITGQL